VPVIIGVSRGRPAPKGIGSPRICVHEWQNVVMLESNTSLIMRRLADTPVHRRDVADIIMASADYSLLVEGHAPTSAAVDDFFLSRPPGFTAEQKYSLGFYAGDVMVGIADVLRGWNAPHKIHVGLLMIQPKFYRRGYGRRACACIESLAHELNATTVRIAVVANNVSAFPFWEAVGFVRNGEVKPKMPPFTDDIVILEKTLLKKQAQT
jgi:ribosomal protein S18 acetylase RimI-like enzyme